MRLKISKHTAFWALGILLSAGLYMLACYNTAAYTVGVPAMFQKTLTLSTDTPVQCSFRYVTVDVERFNMHLPFGVAAGEKKFRENMYPRSGYNIFDFGAGGVKQKVSVIINEESPLILDVKNIILSNHVLAPANAMLFFCIFAAVLWALLYLVFYKDFLGFMRANSKLFLVLIILLQAAHILYYANAKNDYHTDEMAAHVQASGGKQNQVEYFKFIDGERFGRALTVAPGDEWSFGTVKRTVSASHPPLFHWQLHAVESFFPGVYSKWFAICINLFWFILSGVLLYFLSLIFFKDKLVSLLTVMLFGFSPGAAAMVLYARMYVTACFFAMLLIYLVFRLMEEKGEKAALYILLGATAFTGLTAHYYFLIWACSMSLVFAVILIKAKQYIRLRNYTLAMACGVLLNFLFMPVLQNILFSSRGVEASKNIRIMADFIFNIMERAQGIDMALFGAATKFLLAGAVALFLFTYIYTRYKKLDERALSSKLWSGDINASKTAVIFFGAGIYFLIIAKIAPYGALRYSYIILPMVLISMFAVLMLFMRYALLAVRKDSPPTITSVLVLLTAVMMAFNFTQQKEKMSILCTPFFAGTQGFVEDFLEGAQAIVVEPQSWVLAGLYGPNRNEYLHFSHYKEIYFMPYEDGSYMDIKRALEPVLEHLDKSKPAALYADSGAAWAIRTILEPQGWQMKQLLDRNYTDLYILTSNGEKK